MIEFKNVKKIYDNGTVALDGVDLTIEDGEFVFIVGASGAGKSTLTKLLTREETITEGSLTVDEFDLVNMPERKIPYYRRRIGVVFQDFRLIPDMTVYENVAFAMEIVGEPKAKIKRTVGKVLETVGLIDKRNVFPNQLSGGEQQRVALARALANNAKTIIADEPTGNIDPRRSLEIMNLLIKIHKKNKTVIVVTHEKQLVDYFHQRVVTIENGVVVSDRVGGMFNEKV
ncbi:MAG: cell division ATP-binding protein FtsE [Ruminococcaceae bacterium]|nr:cell division ATP-binding protein FtsE [Oscillospiraceae bacterium]MBO5039926.1 cell division ATP-binding protein FtsE [Clostridia bacterium]